MFEVLNRWQTILLRSEDLLGNGKPHAETPRFQEQGLSSRLKQLNHYALSEQRYDKSAHINKKQTVKEGRFFYQ